MPLVTCAFIFFQTALCDQNPEEVEGATREWLQDRLLYKPGKASNCIHLKELFKAFLITFCVCRLQRGISRNKPPAKEFQRKIEAIAAKMTSVVGVPLQVLVAVGDGIYRKPVPGMWQRLQDLVQL